MTASRAATRRDDAMVEARAAAADRRLVPVLTLATFVTMLQAMALAPLLPAISDDLGTSVSLLGQIPAATMFLAAAIGFVAGPLADRYGHHRILLASLMALVASSLGMAIAPGYLVLFAATMIGAVGRAVVQPVATVIVGERYDGDRQRRAVSWVMAGVSGAVIGGVPVLTAVADAAGWRAPLAGLALIIAALIPLVRWGLGPAVPSRTDAVSLRNVLAAYRPIVADRPTLGLIAASLLGSAGIWIMATYVGAFYDDRHGYTTAQIGWVFFVPGVTIFLGTLATGGRIGALPLRPVVMLTRVVTGVIIAAVFVLPLHALVGIGLFGIQGFTTAIALVAVVLLLMRESPASRATTLTLNTVALSLGYALGSMLGGALLAIGDYELIGLASLLLNLGAAGAVWLTPLAHQNSPPDSGVQNTNRREARP
jgi:predicted MFS family arabinose efflux permease